MPFVAVVWSEGQLTPAGTAKEERRLRMARPYAFVCASASCTSEDPNRKRFLLPRQVKYATSCRNTWDCAKWSTHRKDLHLHVLCFGGRPPCPR